MDLIVSKTASIFHKYHNLYVDVNNLYIEKDCVYKINELS